MAFDSAAYLERLHLKTTPPADREGLNLLQRHQRMTIPFENLDVALGRGISLDPDIIFDKLVVRRRGGYCFEQNLLFLAGLRSMGFTARPLLARVWLGQQETPAKTHMLLLVDLEGELWIADAGFGGSYSPPMRLVDGAQAESSDGARHRLRREPDHGWMLDRLGDGAATDGRGVDHDGWLPQYSFTEASVWPADVALANHWTASAPSSRFVQHRVVSLVLPTGFASLVDRDYSRRTSTEAVSATIDSARAYRLRLNFVFGLHLDEAEVAALRLY